MNADGRPPGGLACGSFWAVAWFSVVVEPFEPQTVTLHTVMLACREELADARRETQCSALLGCVCALRVRRTAWVIHRGANAHRLTASPRKLHFVLIGTSGGSVWSAQADAIEATGDAQSTEPVAQRDPRRGRRACGRLDVQRLRDQHEQPKRQPAAAGGACQVQISRQVTSSCPNASLRSHQSTGCQTFFCRPLACSCSAAKSELFTCCGALAQLPALSSFFFFLSHRSPRPLTRVRVNPLGVRLVTVLSADGYTCSTRLEKLLALDSVVLMQQSVFHR